MIDLVHAITVFNEFCQSNTPPELLPGNEQNTNTCQGNVRDHNNNRNNDYHGNNGNGGNSGNTNNNNNSSNKHQWGRGQQYMPTQFPLPQPITTIKAQVQAKNPNISLTQILQEGSKMVRQLLQATNTPDTTCTRALFWGECAKQQCNFNHKAPLLWTRQLQLQPPCYGQEHRPWIKMLMTTTSESLATISCNMVWNHHKETKIKPT